MNNNHKKFVIISYVVILTLTVLIAVMLLSEYRYFKREAYELAQVKEAYYQHVEMLKRSLNASITQESDEETDNDGEKKNNR